MANPESESLILIIVIGTLGMLILVVAIILFVVFYQKKYIKHQLELHKTQADHQEKVLHTITEVQEEERKRIAENLHDETGALLSTIKLLIHQMGSSENSLAELVKETKKLIDQSIDSIKRTIRDLTPSVLEKFGLIASVRELCNSIDNSEKIKVTFNTNDENLKQTNKMELALYRIIQEILNNAIKHAEAKEIRVLLRSSNGNIQLTIEDDGKGFDPEIKESDKGLGLKNIESRIYLINGKYTLHTSPGTGTKYIIEIPGNENKSIKIE